MTMRIYYDKNGASLFATLDAERTNGEIRYNVFNGEAEITVEAESKLEAFEKARKMYERNLKTEV